MPDFDDDLERVFGARFGALHGSIAGAVPLPEAGQIVARARRRRRNAHAVLAGVAVVAMVAAGFAALGPLRAGRPTAPGRDFYAGDRGTAAPPYAPPAGASRDLAGSSIPFGFVPRDEADVREGMSAVPPAQCPGRTALVRVRESLVAGRSWQRTGTPEKYRLLAYQTGSVGSAAFNELVAEAERCATATDGVLTWSKQVEQLTLGAESIRVTTRYTKATRGALPPNQVQMVVRWGGAVLIADGPSSSTVARNTELLERRLCVFARDCAARDGRPEAIRELTVGGDAWAVVLAVDVDANAVELGRAIADASEMGYRTSVASVDCDQGARAGLGLPLDSPEHYVAVYFAEQSDAEFFAARSSVPTIATVDVRTYCIG